jgi:hypothetical protein
MIEVTDLSKQYGDMLAVDHLSFLRGARPGDRVSRAERRREVNELATWSGLPGRRPGPVPWQGSGTLCAWTAPLPAVAFYLLRRRDAEGPRRPGRVPPRRAVGGER